VQYVKPIKRGVTHGLDGELFLFNGTGQGKKLNGPTKNMKCVQYGKLTEG